MPIQPETVRRDSRGYWTHSQHPPWGESVTALEIMTWCEQNKVNLAYSWFEHEAPAMAQHNYYELGHDTCLGWDPEPPTKDAFCLSIHDTEDGPVAVYLAPIKSGN